MTSVLKKSRGTKGKSESMQEDLPSTAGIISCEQSEEVDKFIKFIDDNVIGKETSFCGPFGRRKVVYCDYVGSGRALHWLEAHIASHVLPTHATRCTGLSHSSGQSELYRAESKEIIRSCVGAGDSDVVVLGGSLPRLLRSVRPHRAVLFVSSRETERQLAPWREIDAEIIKIPETKEGFIDLNNLESKLQEHSKTGKRLIGFFPAASKLTGVLADDVATTLLLHQYGAWSFWDYTLVAPSAAVDMNPMFPGVQEEMVKKDAVFFNIEKFVGGVQGPYVAVVKKGIFKDTPLYSDNVEVLCERIEEWKCTEAVRTALVMQLRDAVGLQTIADRQDEITRQVLSHIKNIPELILLGSESPTVRRLPIFSLMVKHPRGTFLHHNFVSAVLNDVFGIQARGGLSNNLTYGEDILGIDQQLLKEYEKLLDVESQKEIARFRKISDAKAPEVPIHNEHLRPGFCRVSFPYFMSESELAFILEALKMVATEGWKILPQYVVNPQTGQWRHHSSSVLKDKRSLYNLRFHDGKITSNERRISGPGIFPQTYTECLLTARNLFNRARKLAMKCTTAQPEVSFNPRIDYMRWFMLPKEAHDLLLGKSANVKHIVPFDPSGFTGARKSLHYTRSATISSPILGSSARHFSLSAIDDCQILRFKQKQKFFSRESSVKEVHLEEPSTMKSKPVHFAIGGSVSPVHLHPPSKSVLIRSRCYSLGSDSPAVPLSARARINLGLKESSPNSILENASGFCNCGSQTDLQSLDDPMISPGKSFPYSAQSSASISDCSQTGRASPTASLSSHTSEDLHAYVKEMTKEIATEIKSEIREVISRVDDILENSDALDQSNISINSTSSQSDRNSVSVIDVAQYLMGMSREMASEVKHEIREMVSQVDEMISPDYTGNGSRRSSPPNSARKRIGSGPELGLNLQMQQSRLKKCPTSPVLPIEFSEEDQSVFFMSSPTNSPKSSQRTPSLEASCLNNISFNSSETSTPDTIIQVVTTPDNVNLPKSLSSNKISDDETCSELTCRHCCIKKHWCQNPSVSSQDSGINLSFGEGDCYSEFIKWRTSSDPTTNKSKKYQCRMKLCQMHEKNEVPDIIEGVPVCDEKNQTRQSKRSDNNESNKVNFKLPEDVGEPSRETSALNSKRSSRSSNASSSSSDRSSRSSGYVTDGDRLSTEDHEFDRSESECQLKRCCWSEEGDDSSACSDDFTFDDEGLWHAPPKPVWKAVVEAVQEFGMVRGGERVLACVSGSRASVAMLHALHHYQYYARGKGLHFTLGALFIHEPRSSVDPLHMMAYCRALGVKFIYQDKLEDDQQQRRGSNPPSYHRWSTHSVRRRAYAAAAAHGYHALAVCQSLDHAAAAMLAAAFRGHALATVKAHYCVREQNVRVIRPLIYARDGDIESFGSARMLPDFRSAAAEAAAHEEATPHASPDDSDASGSDTGSGPHRSSAEVAEVADDGESAALRRARAALRREERAQPALYASLRHALRPLLTASSIDKDIKESRHRKKSVIQMKNGAPVYDSEEGTDEEPVP